MVRTEIEFLLIFSLLLRGTFILFIYLFVYLSGCHVTRFSKERKEPWKVKKK